MMQAKLDILLSKYAVQKNAQLSGNTVMIDGKALPLLPWRKERRLIELRNLAAGPLTGISTMRVLRIVHRGADLMAELYREIDIAQYILNSKIREIFAIGDKAHALNLIAKTADDYVVSFEISATLPENAPIIDKHEIIAIAGVACDRAADTQVPQNSIYVYGDKETAAYTDVDAELFGLTADQCAVVRSAFEIAKTGADLTAEAESAKAVLCAAEKSLETLENIFVEG